MEARGTQDGERKTITALFADIKSSVELMEGLDPEEARAIVDPALQLMMDAVHRYEGYVAQSRGDGIFALFGAPIAQEDHARRALYAALRMQEEIKRYSDRLRIEKGVPLQIRVGLNSGEMVVRSIRKDDLHTDYVPIGHSVNLAAAYRLARPIEQTSIPATVQAVLAARIDRLGEREKTVLQTASVIGKEFSEPILKRVSDLSEANLAASLGTLGAAEFLYEKAIYPEAEYAFKHPLTQEVAYGSQLAERRSRVHAAVAQAIEELAGEKLDERAALLAHHCENAGEPMKAALWHGRAGESLTVVSSLRLTSIETSCNSAPARRSNSMGER
jgi:class 3 adenylate cyclase